MTVTKVPQVKNRSPEQMPRRIRHADWVTGRALVATFGKIARFVVVPCGFLLVAAIGLLDYGTEGQLSLALFYLLPIAVVVWWGGFPHGVLISLAGVLAWHLAEYTNAPAAPLVILLWKGLVRFIFFVVVSSMLSRLRDSMLRERALARTDPLTGAANGRTFYEKVGLELARTRRTGRPLTLAYVDVDDFKRVNDQFGHAAGDEVLRQVTQTMQANMRGIDTLARLGGDEFALLLPDTGAPAAALAVERLRLLLGGAMGRRGWPVTFSIGVATFLQPIEEDVDVMIHRVDALMYSVKKSGKDRIRHEVVQSHDTPVTAEPRDVERRTSTRMPCNHPVHLYPIHKPGGAGMFALIRDISDEGMGLFLENRLADQTLLTIELLHGYGPKSWLVRVVRSVKEDGGWLHGCVLSTRLSLEEVRYLLAVSAEEESSLEPLPLGASSGR